MCRGRSFRTLLLDNHRAVRAATFRAIRYITLSAAVLPLFKQLRIYFFCIRSVGGAACPDGLPGFGQWCRVVLSRGLCDLGRRRPPPSHRRRPGVVRSLDRDKKYATERMEALKLVRKIAVRAPPLVCHTNTGCV